MLKNDLREVGKLESTEVKAAPRAYETPELVVLGQAYHLVQADDYTKLTQESNGYFKD